MSIIRFRYRIVAQGGHFLLFKAKTGNRSAWVTGDTDLTELCALLPGIMHYNNKETVSNHLCLAFFQLLSLSILGVRSIAGHLTLGPGFVVHLWF